MLSDYLYCKNPRTKRYFHTSYVVFSTTQQVDSGCNKSQDKWVDAKVFCDKINKYNIRKCVWSGGCCGRSSSLVAASINQEAAVVSVVLYQALCPDSSLASLSAPAPRTWLSTLPDSSNNMHRKQDGEGGEIQFKAGRRGRISTISADAEMPIFLNPFSSLSLILSSSEKSFLFSNKFKTSKVHILR